MSSYCAMCQVVQESCVERLWVPQSVEPAEALRLARSLSTCLPLQLLCLQLCSAVLEATGSCGHSQGTCSFTFRSPVLQRVEETFLTVQWPLWGWPQTENCDYRDGDLESKVISDVLLACFYSVSCDAPSLLLQSMLWTAVYRHLCHLSR